MRRSRSVLPVAVAAGLSLAAALILPAVPAAASSSVLVAKGAVKDGGGRAISGTTVRLYAWPPDHVLQSLKPKQLVPLKLLATAKTSSDGSYRLSATPASLVSAAVASGVANLEVDSGTASWDFSYSTTAAGRAENPGGSQGSVTANLVGSTHAQPKTCGWAYMKQRNASWAIVGQGYVLAKGITQQFTYSNGQNSTLGIGYSPSAEGSGYHADGSETESSGQSQDFRKHYKSYAWYETKFRVGQYGWYCGGEGFKPPYKVRSNGYYGGAKVYHPKKRPRYQECASEPGGQTVTTHRERAVRWSGGFDIAQVGFSASSQTGYDSSAELKYKYSSHGGYECGTNHDAPAQSPQLIARGR
ncbi:MAG TPA: hypothetical protein VGG25_28155 [Streptosporangiaceae bacterium]|jgi:hypothetical protein